MLIGLKKMRNALIRDGRLGKYILYAIGEILLVVTGILIALQVNNHNLERQVKLVELHYYQTMKVQLTEDRKILEDEVRDLTERIEAYLIGVRLIKNNDRKMGF